MKPADALLRGVRRTAMHRALAQFASLALPWWIVAAVVAWRLDAGPWTLPIVAAALAIGLWWAWRIAQRFDDRWLARALNRKRADMEDSADLLLARAPASSTAASNPLESLQRERLRQRLESAPAPDLGSPWRHSLIAANGLLALACMAAMLLWPAASIDSARDAAARITPATAAQPAQLVGQHIDITPPAYTGLPARRVDELAAKIPEGAALRWTLRFAPLPERAELVFHDGERVALERDGDDWTARRRIDQPALYRIVLEHPLPPAQAQLHRLDVVADRPPELRALQPASNLTVLTPGQRSWSLAFEASDDYGLAPTAQLRITRTEGSGENITSREQVLTLHGQGSAMEKRYAHRIDLAALGLVAGDDLIVQLSVSDRRTPSPQVTRSPSFLLRWPPAADVDISGLDGLVKRSMPAYFRSQRQIIIDAEALLGEKPALDSERYLQRSDAIGVDQRLLRLRYGQFLGEQSEATPRRLMPTNDAQDEHADDPAGATHDRQPANSAESQTTTPAPPGSHEDAHADGPEPQREATFGEQQSVLEEFGHTHDIAEAATLLDPETRELLRAALNEMWQSELHLRQGQPDRALPYANQALRLIKQVQESERIYLPRLGMELPAIDPTRRLGGDREGLGNRGELLSSATVADPVLADIWRALVPVPDATAVDLDALSRWLAAHPATAAAGVDPLALAVEIDALRRDDTCTACRERLRALLWPLLPRPPAAIGERQPTGATGDAYLDALGREARP